MPARFPLLRRAGEMLLWVRYEEVFVDHMFDFGRMVVLPGRQFCMRGELSWSQDVDIQGTTLEDRDVTRRYMSAKQRDQGVQLSLEPIVCVGFILLSLLSRETKYYQLSVIGNGQSLQINEVKVNYVCLCGSPVRSHATHREGEGTLVWLLSTQLSCGRRRACSLDACVLGS